MGSSAQNVVTSSTIPSWQRPADETTPGWGSHWDFVNCLDGAHFLLHPQSTVGCKCREKKPQILVSQSLAIMRTLNEHKQVEQKYLCCQVMEFWFVLAASS